MSASAENDCRFIESRVPRPSRAPRPGARSGSQLLVLGIVRGVDEHRRALALAQDLDLEGAADGGVRGLDVTEREALGERVSVIAGGGSTDELAARVEQRLVAQRIGVG